VIRSIVNGIKAHPQGVEDFKYLMRFLTFGVVVTVFLYMMLLH
jgi:hypothetical protein